MSRATRGRRAKRFPPRETGLIAGIVERDLPSTTPRSAAFGVAINDFARRMSILDEGCPVLRDRRGPVPRPLAVWT
jgi:hypothetical protein